MLSVFHDSERVCICTYEWEELRSLVSHMGIYKCSFTFFESMKLCWIFFNTTIVDVPWCFLFSFGYLHITQSYHVW